MLFTGGDEGGRTPYLLNAIQALYQLSYSPKSDNERNYIKRLILLQPEMSRGVKFVEKDALEAKFRVFQPT